MDKKEYSLQLFEIYKSTCMKLQALQNSLSKEEIIEYRINMDYFWIHMLEASVGEEALLHYMIDLLNTVSKREWLKNDMNKKQMDRADRLIKDIKDEDEN